MTRVLGDSKIVGKITGKKKAKSYATLSAPALLTSGSLDQLGALTYMVARMNDSSSTFMEKSLFCSIAFSCFALCTMAQTTAPTPGSAARKHADEVDRRGDQGMGFSHEMTGHHFHLLSDGGAVEVEAKSPNDEGSKSAVRRHMLEIAGMFRKGDFSLPMFIHDTVPPGVEVMKRLKDQIIYTAENTPKGAQVRIATTNSEALAAVHEFLRFQIKDHRTGDPLALQPNRSS